MTEEEFVAVLKLIDSTARIGWSSAGAAGVVTIAGTDSKVRVYATGRTRKECVKKLMEKFAQGEWK